MKIKIKSNSLSKVKAKHVVYTARTSSSYDGRLNSTRLQNEVKGDIKKKVLKSKVTSVNSNAT